MNEADPVILMQDAGGGWLRFRRPRRVLVADRATGVQPLLRAVDEAAAQGLAAAGFLTYEAAPGLDAAYRTHAPGRLPCAWFALCDEVEAIATLDAPDLGTMTGARVGDPGAPDPGVDVPGVDVPGVNDPGPWTASIDRDRYEAGIRRIREHLAAGDTYQVNHTFRLRAPFDGEPAALFARLVRGQRARHAAFIDTGAFAICSVSPELFFALDGERLVSRPMKGTSRRGLTVDEDRELARALVRSEKERAENVMIVDMVRNDLGRVAVPGSVRVERLFEVERFPTLLQLTSTVSCRTAATLTDIVGALFPCASITGAPKVRTMELIHDLECSPRGIYTGCVGHVLPGRRAHFNVAIRTVHVDKATAVAEYGVGGGIVWDSLCADEYEECRIKAAVLAPAPPRFELLETMLWEPEEGFALLERHLARLAGSAGYFGFALDLERVRARLEAVAAGLAAGAGAGAGATTATDAATSGAAVRVRLTVAEDGAVRVTWTPLQAPATGGDATAPLVVALAAHPVRADDRFLYHKTTHREVYDRARAGVPGVDDVLLWNERGEVTESTIANLVVERDGRRVTPPVRCGLLAGTMRARLLERGEIEEAVVTRAELGRADRLFLINSVRGWMPCALRSTVDASRHPESAPAGLVAAPTET